MSFRTIFTRIGRIVSSELGPRNETDFAERLRRAEALLEEARYRAEHPEAKSTPEDDEWAEVARIDREKRAAAYKALGVADGAPLEEASAAYRKLLMQLHPDRVAQLGREEQERAHVRTQELNAAFAYLRATVRA